MFGVGIDARGARAGGAEAERAFEGVRRRAGGAAKAVRRVDSTLARAGRRAVALRGQFSSLFIGFAGIFAVRSAFSTLVEFESGLIGVAKTADLTAGEIEELAKSVTELSLRTPLTTTALLEMGSVAGQLGVRGVADITKFAETLGMLESATDGAFGGRKAASELAGILFLTGTAASNVDRLASSMVGLGNTTNATEAEISAIALEVAKSTQLFDLSAAEVVGLSNALAILKLDASRAGGAVGFMFQRINEAAQGGDTLKIISELLGGATQQEIRDRFQTEPLEVFIDVLKGVKETGRAAIGVLEDLKLPAIRAGTPLANLAVASEQLEESLASSNKLWRENTAAQVEFERRVVSIEGRLGILRNTLNAVVTEQRDNNDAIIVFIDSISDAIKIIFQLDSALEGNATNATLMAVALTTITIAMSTLVATTFIGWAIGATAALGGMIAPILAAAAAVDIFTIALAAIIALPPLVALAGVAFGTALRDQFVSVELGIQELAASFVKFFRNLEFLWDAGLLKLRFLFEDWAQGVSTILADMLIPAFRGVMSAISLELSSFIDDNVAFIRRFAGDTAAAVAQGMSIALRSNAAEPPGGQAQALAEGAALGIGAGGTSAFQRRLQLAQLRRDRQRDLDFLRQETEAEQQSIFDEREKRTAEGRDPNFFQSMVNTFGFDFGPRGLPGDDTSGQNEFADQAEESAEANAKAQADIREELAKTQRAFAALGSSVASAFERALFEGQSLKEAMRSLVDDIGRLIVRLQILRLFKIAAGVAVGGPVGAVISQILPSAQGSIIRRANFGHGGVFMRPTDLPLADGRTVARVSEASRDEVVMPITRLPSGRMGVEMAGGGGREGDTIHIQMPVLIMAENVDALGRSNRQAREFAEKAGDMLIDRLRR